jgi:hypothetical protein
MHKRRLSVRNLIGFLSVMAVCCEVSAQYISADTYTRYELLAPESHQFKIYYEVTETRVGARFQFNAIREGSDASDESVVDLATGKPLKFKSYYTEGDQIVFKRPLGIPPSSVVLPVGYEIVSCSVATQVLTEPDGRLKLAFLNSGSGGQLDVTIRAKKLPAKNSSTTEPLAKPMSGLERTHRTHGNAGLLRSLRSLVASFERSFTASATEAGGSSRAEATL